MSLKLFRASCVLNFTSVGTQDEVRIKKYTKPMQGRSLLSSLIGRESAVSTTNGLAAFIDIAMAWSWRERSIHASSNAAVVVAMSVGRDWRGWVFNVEQGVGVGEVGQIGRASCRERVF